MVTGLRHATEGIHIGVTHRWFGGGGIGVAARTIVCCFVHKAMSGMHVCFN